MEREIEAKENLQRVEKEGAGDLSNEKKFVNLVAKILVKKVIKKANEKGIEIFKVQQ